MCIHYKLPEGSVILCNIYAPNLPSTRKDFFSVLPSFVPGNSPCILGGDFNCVPDISIDRLSRFASHNCSVGIAELDLFNRQRDMLDVWRVLHQRGSSFTWHKPDGTDASRLDRFYAPITFTCLRCDIIPCPLSDHDAVKAYFQLPGDLAIGKGFWKLNTDILKEEEFRRDFLLRYEGWQSLKPAFLTLTDWWEEIKSRVKDFAVKYCVVRARRRREEFLALCSRVRAGSSVALHTLCMVTWIKSYTGPGCVRVYRPWRLMRDQPLSFTGMSRSMLLIVGLRQFVTPVVLFRETLVVFLAYTGFFTKACILLWILTGASRN